MCFQRRANEQWWQKHKFFTQVEVKTGKSRSIGSEMYPK